MRFPRYMMATKALSGGTPPHDISRDTPDLCCVDAENGDEYIGTWESGFGFVNVRFPKTTTHDLSDADIAKYRALFLSAPWGTRPALDPNVAVGPDMTPSRSSPESMP